MIKSLQKNLLSFRRAIHIDAVGEKAINCDDKFDSKKKIEVWT
jgi:hypothetical protein